MKRQDLEGKEQRQFAADMRLYFPKVLWTISIAGTFTTLIQRRQLNLKGYSKGTPDIWIFEPRGKYHGLVIELKKLEGGTLSPEQKDWLKELNKRGYLGIRCDGAGEALQIVSKYMEM